MNPVSAPKVELWRAISFHPFHISILFHSSTPSVLTETSSLEPCWVYSSSSSISVGTLPFLTFLLFSSFLGLLLYLEDCPWEDPSGSGGSWEHIPNLNHPYISVHEIKRSVNWYFSTSTFAPPQYVHRYSKEF